VRTRTWSTNAPDVPVEALLEDYPPPLREIAERLRVIVKRAVPEATERVRVGWRLIAYDVPVGRGRTAFFAWVSAEKRHAHLGFPRGVHMNDPGSVLQGAGITKLARWLTFVPGDQIDDGRLEALVQEATRVAWRPRGLPWTIERAAGSSTSPPDPSGRTKRR
jgi:hypothetical protein